MSRSYLRYYLPMFANRSDSLLKIPKQDSDMSEIQQPMLMAVDSQIQAYMQK